MQKKFKLNGGNWGGLRENAGRPRQHSKGVSHRVRETVNHRAPLHINFRYVRNIRSKEALKLLRKAIKNARSHGLRIQHYSFQSNHIHLIIEATDNKTLTKGMRSLTITIARNLKLGRIQTGRYHLHVLKTLKEVKHAVHYVLFNQQKHETGICSTINEYSSVFGMKEVIRKFAKEKRMTLKIATGEPWAGDPAKSFLLRSIVAKLAAK